jgi:hypothetical protein
VLTRTYNAARLFDIRHLDVLFHEPGRPLLQDVVTCIRHNVTIDELRRST